MPKIDTGKYRKKLLEARESARREIEAVDRDITSGDTPEIQGGLANYDNHPADAGTQTFEKEKDLAVRESFREVIGRIDEALGKIERGTYGECDRCGREIAMGRLDAVPYAIYCVDCQDSIEGR